MTRFVRNLIAIVIIVLTASPSYAEDDKPRIVFNDDAQMLGDPNAFNSVTCDDVICVQQGRVDTMVSA